jgi:electron-transferring-flavoprotein dehydrogenase
MTIHYDVLIVGGGISGLSTAHRLVDLAVKENRKIRIAVLEKGKTFGGHILSGAVSNPRAVKKLFPDYQTNGFPIEGVCRESYLTVLGREKAWDVPSLFSPPEMNKKGYLILSQSSVCGWMAANLLEKVKEKPEIVVDIYNGFPASEILYENGHVVGVRVDDTGNPEKDDCYANLTVFADKGFLSRDLIAKYKLAGSFQTWAVGVKEVWEVKNDYSGKVWHTMGYPLLDGTFGGGFIYGLARNRLSLGIVIGLDAENPNLRPPQLLQDMKKHPMVQRMINGGKLVKYGAALIPEGGYCTLPKEFGVHGALVAGDALGIMDVKGFSGVDKAMECGSIAGEVAFEAVKSEDFSMTTLSAYKEKVMKSWVGKELEKAKSFRWALHEKKELFSKYLPGFVDKMDGYGPYVGGLLNLLSSPGALSVAREAKKLMDGKGSVGEIRFEEDCTQNRPGYRPNSSKEPSGYDKNTIYSTADIVFYAATHYHEENAHIEEFDAEACKKCIEKYETHGNDVPCVGDCTAEVHEVLEIEGEKIHHMNLENCVQCRTCEIVCPERNLRVNAALHGSGPDFSGM